MNKIKKLSMDNKLGILLFLISFIFVGIMFWACFKISITQDDAFSLILIQKSYFDVVATTTLDVHPPLYYFILKFVVSLFQIFHLTADSTIIIAKFVSVIPFVLLLLLSFLKIKDNFGWLCCGIFAICLVSMPQMMHYSVAIRMYSWGLFFVTLCFIYAHSVIVDSNRKNWIILNLSCICAAYTHYFAAIPVIIIFLLLLTYFIFNNKYEIHKWLISVIVSSSLYLFWLFILIDQFIAVNKDYWIEPITFSSLFNYLWFIFSPTNIFYPTITIIGILLILSYLIVFVYYFIKCKPKVYEHFMLSGTFVLILTVVMGVTVSVLLNPVFISRYMFPSLGVFWLTFAFLLSKTWNYKKVFVPILIIIFVVSFMSTTTFINFETEVHNNYDDLNSFLKQDSIKNDNIIIDTNGKYCLLEIKPIQYLLWTYHNKNLSELNLALKDNKTLWLFSSKDCNLIFKNCTKQNMTIKKYKSYNGFGQDTYANTPYNIYNITS